MYVRFHSPWAQVRHGIDYGIFRPAYACSRDERVPEILRLAIRHQLDWFEEHLPIPAWRSFCVRSRGQWLQAGICWFVDAAREPIARAYAVAGLLGECGVPVAKVATHCPGQILYRDHMQVVAKPDAATPTLWH